MMVLQRRDALGAGIDLVDLLLVLHDREADPGMVEHIGHLVGHRVGIDRHRDGAERLRRGKGPVEPRPVGADDGDLVAARQAERPQPERQVRDLVELLAPGPALPDAEILVAHGRAITQPLGIVQQIFRKCVRFAGQCRRGHLTVPPGPRGSRLWRHNASGGAARNPIIAMRRAGTQIGGQAASRRYFAVGRMVSGASSPTAGRANSMRRSIGVDLKNGKRAK